MEPFFAFVNASVVDSDEEANLEGFWGGFSTWIEGKCGVNCLGVVIYVAVISFSISNIKS